MITNDQVLQLKKALETEERVKDALTKFAESTGLSFVAASNFYYSVKNTEMWEELGKEKVTYNQPIQYTLEKPDSKIEITIKV